MWWLSSSLLPLVGSLYIQASTALTTTDIFSPLKNGVVCTDAQITTMNTCITDTIALATIFDSALKAAVQSTETTGTEGQDGVVARKLLTKWFGIKFTGSGEQSPDSDSADAWTQIQGNACWKNPKELQEND